MARIAVLGAGGRLGRRVVAQAVASGHEVTAVVRSAARLGSVGGTTAVECDIATLPTERLASLLRGHDAVVHTAGFVSDGPVFVALVDHVVSALESLPPAARPPAWFIAGAAVLELGNSGRRAVELPVVRGRYWPHAANMARLEASAIDWRLLCPGPMVQAPVLGPARLQSVLDQVPFAVPASARWLPAPLLLPLVARGIPRMIVSYDDAAGVMLANLAPSGAMTRRRVGLALPDGLRGRKDRAVVLEAGA